MASAGARVISLDELDANAEGVAGVSNRASHEPWSFTAMRSRLVEISARGASAALTTAIELVAQAQAAAEPVAWMTLPGVCFYPPDVADNGVDLAALVVVRVPDATVAARSAERVLRSGAFGLVVLDLGSGDLSMVQQGRLVTLAQAHDAAVVCLTDKSSDAASLGSLVSLRAETLRRREPGSPAGEFSVTMRAIKDKRRGPGWTHAQRRRGPAGLL